MHINFKKHIIHVVPFRPTLGLTIINTRGELLEAAKSLEVLVTRLNTSYTLDLRLDVIAKHGNDSDEIAGR